MTKKPVQKPEIQPAGLTAADVEALRRWLAVRTVAPGNLDGFSLGRSYIDTRQRGGKSYHERAAYVKVDHATARIVPSMAGKSAFEIEALIAAIVPAAPVRSNLTEPY